MRFTFTKKNFAELGKQFAIAIALFVVTFVMGTVVPYLSDHAGMAAPLAISAVTFLANTVKEWASAE